MQSVVSLGYRIFSLSVCDNSVFVLLHFIVLTGPKKDPLFSMNPLKYKNYVFELARKYGWREPVFTESNEDDGKSFLLFLIHARTFP